MRACIPDTSIVQAFVMCMCAVFLHGWNRVMTFLWSPPTPPTPSHFTHTLHTCLHSLRPGHLPFTCDCIDLHADSALTTATTVGGGKDTILSYKVSGELVSSVTCEECAREVSCLLCRPSRPSDTL